MPSTTLQYGNRADNVADLRVPDEGGFFPVVVLLHGGFWRDAYERDLMEPLAVDLAGRGWASWNVEFRRVGSGGGVPETLDDVDAALDYLRDVDAPLDLERVAAVGHSSGGQLALYAAKHPLVSAAVALAGVCDLAEANRRRMSGDAAGDFVGGSPEEFPDAYDRADPMRRVPTGVPQLLVHGDADRSVPIDLSRRYAERAAESGDQCTLDELAGVDHFALTDPTHPSWASAVGWLEQALPGERRG